MPTIPKNMIKGSEKLDALRKDTIPTAPKKSQEKVSAETKPELPSVPPPLPVEPTLPDQVAETLEETTTIEAVEDTNTPAPQDSLLLSDEFVPPSINGQHPIIAKPGFVVTPVMATHGAMALYSRNGVVYLKYQDAPNYIENMAIISRGPDGMARYADCVLAVETQKHYDARMDHKSLQRKLANANALSTSRDEMVSRIDMRGFGDMVTSPQAEVKIE